MASMHATGLLSDELSILSLWCTPGQWPRNTVNVSWCRSDSDVPPDVFISKVIRCAASRLSAVGRSLLVCVNAVCVCVCVCVCVWVGAFSPSSASSSSFLIMLLAFENEFEL